MTTRIAILYSDKDHIEHVALGIYDYVAPTFFGDEGTFIVRDIKAGTSREDAIKKKVSEAQVVLVIIGSEWLEAVRSQDDPSVIGLKVALRQNKTIIPVLVDDTKMPTTARLPQSLKKLVKRNPARVRTTNEMFDEDRALLVDQIRELLNLIELEKQGGWFGQLGIVYKILAVLVPVIAGTLTLAFSLLEALPEADRIRFFTDIGAFTPVPTQPTITSTAVAVLLTDAPPTLTTTPAPPTMTFTPVPPTATETAVFVTITPTSAPPDAVLYRDFSNLALCVREAGDHSGLTLRVEGQNVTYSVGETHPRSVVGGDDACYCFQMEGTRTVAPAGCGTPIIETNASISYRNAAIAVLNNSNVRATCDAQPDNREVYRCDVQTLR